MIHRVAILTASLVAALALLVGLVVAGFAPSAAPIAAEPVSAPVIAATDVPPPVVHVDTVYVAPAAAPQEVVVTKVVKAPRSGGDDENEHEGSDD